MRFALQGATENDEAHESVMEKYLIINKWNKRFCFLFEESDPVRLAESPLITCECALKTPTKKEIVM